jgi:2-amino-4-hydroxy-6-hydroxymethyldihydropteridine diphosphokinase
MIDVFVSIGTNIQREKHIARAIRLLCLRYGQLRLSSVYESAAVGFTGSPFYNLVASFPTREPPLTIAKELRAIEERCGRIRNGARYSSRTMDLDLLLYGDAVLTMAELSVPRPEILTEAFVLRPLAELAGHLRHPIRRQTFRQLWAQHDGSQEALWPVELDLEVPRSCGT